MQTINKIDLKVKLDNGREVYLIDVREPFENQEFNIGGMLVPIGKIQAFEIGDIEHLKDKEVVCYCRSGQRSGLACMILEQVGFKHVFNLEGGMLEWQRQ